MTSQEINQVISAMLEAMKGPLNPNKYYLSSTFIDTISKASGGNGQILTKGANSIGIIRSGDEDIILDDSGVAALTATTPSLTINNDANVVEERDIRFKFGGGGSAPSITIIRKYLIPVSYDEFLKRSKSSGRR